MDQTKLQLSSLIRKINKGASTELLIKLIAENTGMLGACRALTEEVDMGGGRLKDWIEQECFREATDPNLVITKLRSLVNLFNPNGNGADPYAVLGLKSSASEEQIKHAYRKLSLKYHPDTSRDENHSEENFIRINIAYHQITAKSSVSDFEEIKTKHTDQSKTHKPRVLTKTRRNRVISLAIGLMTILLLVSLFAAKNFRERTMITSLQQSRGAFIPPKKTVSKANLNSPYLSSHSQKKDISQVDETQSQLPEIKNVKTDQVDNTEKRNEVILIEDTLKKDKYILPRKRAVDSELGEKKEQGLETITKQGDKPEDGKSTLKYVTKTNKVTQTSGGTGSSKAVQKIIEIDSPVQSKTKRLNISDEIPSRISPPPLKLTPGKNNTNGKIDTILPQKTIDTIQEQEQSNSLQQDSLASSSPSKKINTLREPNIRNVVNSFVEQYIFAYEQGNIIQFSQLFMPNALENDMAFVKRVSVYSNLFENTDSRSFKINITQAMNSAGKIDANGRFILSLYYKSGRKFEGEGQVSFELVELEERLYIQKITYKFDEK